MVQNRHSGTIDIPTTIFKGANTLRIWVHYDKGDGYRKQRGYYMSVRPVTLGSQLVNGYRINSVGFSAVDDRSRSFFLEPAARKNPYRLEAFITKAKSVKDEILRSMSEKDFQHVFTLMFN